jgi:hypothetical protein
MSAQRSIREVEAIAVDGGANLGYGTYRMAQKLLVNDDSPRI